MKNVCTFLKNIVEDTILISLIFLLIILLPFFTVKEIIDLIYNLITGQTITMPNLIFYLRLLLIFIGIIFILQIIIKPFQKSEDEEIYTCEAEDDFKCSGKEKRKNMFVAYKVAEELLDGDPFQAIVEKYCCSKECCQKIYDLKLSNNPSYFEEVIKEYNCSTRLPINYYSELEG